MPGPGHARQSYWQAHPERYDLVEDKTEETLQTILIISLHTVLRYDISNFIEYLKEERTMGSALSKILSIQYFKELIYSIDRKSGWNWHYVRPL